MHFSEFLPLVRDGDLEAVRTAVKNNPDLVHTRDPRGGNKKILAVLSNS